jgi:uncharacterized membrane protein
MSTAVEAEAMSLLYEIVQLLLRTVSAHFLCDVFSLQIAVRCSEVCNGLIRFVVIQSCSKFFILHSLQAFCTACGFDRRDPTEDDIIYTVEEFFFFQSRLLMLVLGGVPADSGYSTFETPYTLNILKPCIMCT